MTLARLVCEADKQDSDDEVEVSGKEGGAGVLLDGAAGPQLDDVGAD